MAKNKKKQLNIGRVIYWSVLVTLVIICGFLVVSLRGKSSTSVYAVQLPPSVSLGAMQYSFADGRAVKRSDPSVTALRSFLENDAAHEGCPVQAPIVEQVVAYSKDETQVFLKYGCGAADSPMYAVKTNGMWKMLSPTNHFDWLGLPDCSYVASNHISKEIAPVCANGVVNAVPTAVPTYIVR